MKNRRRLSITAALAGAAILMFLGGCAESGTLIVGDVNFLNNPLNAREFPPSTHPNYGAEDLTDEVCYVRLVDNDGAGAVIWESPACDASLVGNYLYPSTPTPDDGAFIESFLIPLANADLAAAVMPLRLEAYLYDAAVALPPIDPATDAELYSSTGNDDAYWYYSFTPVEGSVSHISLFITVPFS